MGKMLLKHKLEPIPSHRKHIDCKLIDEANHSFNKQYEWSDKLSSEIVSNFKQGISHFIYEVEDNDIKEIDVTIEGKKGQTSASFNNLSIDGIFFISVSIDKRRLLEYPETLKGEICSAISHELMHGNVYFKRYKNNQELNDIPDYYDVVLKIMRSVDSNGIDYFFARALYTCYYQETQAFISQTWPEVKNILSKEYKTIDVDKKLFMDALGRTDTFETFSNNIRISKLISDSPFAISTLIKKFKENGAEIDEEKIKNWAIKILKISKGALRDAINNAYGYWEDEKNK